MHVSVFTPTHDSRFLTDCYRSLASQTLDTWEWVVVLNGDARDWHPPRTDPRVKVRRLRAVRGVGEAKGAACELTSGDLLLELDHDDLVEPNCLAEIQHNFAKHPNAALVYSDFAQVNEDLSRNDQRFDSKMGWEYSEETFEGRQLLRCHALKASPHNVGYIWYAPNHLRAFRRTAYDKVGGYNRRLTVLDDHDLMIRLFTLGDFEHIDRCLYLQRMHPDNTQRNNPTNVLIQHKTVVLYRRHIEALARAWAERNGLAIVSVRLSADLPEPDDDLTIIDPDTQIPHASDSVGLLYATDVVQHATSAIAFLGECSRVLAHGGILVTHTPGARAADLGSVDSGEKTFLRLVGATPRTARSLSAPQLQLSHLRRYYPSRWHRHNRHPYVHANFVALKGGPRQGGPLPVWSEREDGLNRK